MRRVNYLGGSSIVTPASLRREQMQDDRELLGQKSDTRWVVNPKPTTVADATPAKKKKSAVKTQKQLPRANQIRANTLKPGHGRLPKALLQRAAMLKAQVAEGILLPTGKPNPDHPANRKDAKK